MNETIANIGAVVQLADKLLGSATAKFLLNTLAARHELTPEQKANLDENYRSYIEQIAQLKRDQDAAGG